LTKPSLNRRLIWSGLRISALPKRFIFIGSSLHGLSANLPLGTSATLGLPFGIAFTDTIVGDLLGISNSQYFDIAPQVTFTLGNSEFSSKKTFFTGLVVDRKTGKILSAPEGYNPSVPQPSITLGSFMALGFGSLIKKQYSRKCKKIPSQVGI
jgi:hypothetical protein